MISASLIDDLTRIVSDAGAAILRVRAGALDKRDKADGSPVTAADEAAEAIILAGLAALLPGIPVVSEESVDARPEALGARFLLVDPLDGTRELLAGRDEFTVNVALIENGTPLLGIVAAPALGLVWRGHVGHGADALQLDPGNGPEQARECTPIHTRPWGASAVALASLSHLDATTAAFLDRLPGIERHSCGSSIKFCRLAEGAADVYPRFGTTCEWDIAAGHAVLAAAGGKVVNPTGEALRYGQAQLDFRVPAFLAVGDPARLEHLIQR